MFAPFYITILSVSAFVFAVAGTAICLFVARRTHFFDEPNERSNHDHPIPKGAGVAVVLSIVPFMMVTDAPGILAWGMLALAALSYWDDRRGVAPHWRLLAHLGVAVLGAWSLSAPLFQGVVPLWLDKTLIVLLWVWFINLYNFMDGIDGITGTQTAFLGIAVTAIAFLTGALHLDIPLYGMLAAGAALGFLIWNWHPAKIFLGDSGSIPLGFLMGYLLLRLACEGYVFAAAILPAYYLSDATVTLVRRVLAGKKPWQAHSEHYYQQAVRAGRPHDAVVRDMLGVNLLLLMLAAASTTGHRAAVAAVVAAYVLSFCLLMFFASRRHAHFNATVA